MKPGNPEKPKTEKKETGYNFFRRQQDAAMAARKVELSKRRIEIARAGHKFYREKRLVEAVKAYQAYIKIMEDLKGVAEGGLTPAHFDRKSDMAELFLISGIFWDLMKLYDRTQSSNSQKEFHYFSEKFVLFSRNTPFQVLSAESLRKYILREKPMHKAEFQQAYKLLAPPSKCFIATSLLDLSDLETLPRLRRFRDEVLEKSLWGRLAVRTYYRVAPAITLILDHSPSTIRYSVAKKLDLYAERLSGHSINAESSRFFQDEK